MKGGIGIKIPGIWGGIGAFAVAGADDANTDYNVAVAALKRAGFAFNASSALYEMAASNMDSPTPQAIEQI